MDTRGTEGAEYLSEHFSKEDIISKVGFDNIYAIHPVSKILAVKNKSPEVFSDTRMFFADQRLFCLCPFREIYNGTFCGKRPWLFRYHKQMLLAGDAGFRRDKKMNIFRKSWNPEKKLENYKEAAEEYGLDRDTMINVGAFDQGCGAIGAGNIRPGIASESTGSALVTVATIDELSADSKGDVPTLCSGIPGKYMYQPYCTGAMITKWFRDAFCETEKRLKRNRTECVYTK